MNLRTLKAIVGSISAICIAAMIVSAVTNHLGGVVGFGTVSSVAILTMMASSTVLDHEGPSRNQKDEVSSEESARNIENKITALTKSGHDENELRSLVRTAMEFAKREK